MKFTASSLKSFVIASILFYLVTPLNAATIYDESTSGDLSASISLPSLDFALGTNTIIGHTYSSGSYIPGTSIILPDTDIDGFLFNIPSGTQLVGVTYSFTNYSVTEGSITALSRNYQIRDSSTSLYPTAVGGVQIYPAPDPLPISLFVSDLPLDTGSYNWELLNEISAKTVPWYASWDYTIDFQVEENPAPEPSIPWIPLLLLGD